ncbi:MAG: stationary phase survival protein SurE [Acidobacteria bacterium]|nr:stationary phase survival protein SurE [Acidobacteriota bacterium]
MKVILLTNDDGIEAEGLKTLEGVLKGLAHIVVVAPDQERSAVSHGLTLHTPLDFKEVQPDHYVINGTPADCIIMALRQLFVQMPDLVLSGINHGANLGDDIMYSGTVAAAREASAHGVPALAISQAYDEKPIRFREGAAYARELVAALLNNGLSGELCLNVNFPVRKIKGMRITRQGCSEHAPHFNVLDYKAEYDAVPFSPGNFQKTDFMSDRQAILEHFVSITPLQRDQTDYSAAQSLVREASKLFSLK